MQNCMASRRDRAKEKETSIVGPLIALGLGAGALILIAKAISKRPANDAAESRSCRCVPVTAHARCEAIQSLVRPWEVRHLIADLRPFEAVGIVGRWLQQQFHDRTFRWVADPITCDRWCAPSETLTRGTGDCDDFAILVCSMLRACGIAAEVAVGHACGEDECTGHAWVEGHDAWGWFAIEATNGEVIRGVRPAKYHLALLLSPGSCRAA
jgi:transglutaminase-like putative cysteine protease